MPAFLNAVSTALPPHEVHGLFADFARRQITDRRQVVLERMLRRTGIERRWSTLEGRASDVALDAEGFYAYGRFPTTAARLRRYDAEAAPLAARAAAGLDTDGITHLLVTSCTGMAAPGVDIQLIGLLGLDPSVQRTLIGFMGCYAAINALRHARQIVLAEPGSRVLLVSVELCTLHLQETDDLETVLSFGIFGDGAAAALVTDEPQGFRLDGFRTQLMPDARDLITWHVGDSGFDMVLSGEVPSALRASLPDAVREIVPDGARPDLWAIHPGGKSILDAAESALELTPADLSASRGVLREAGNMSSATVLFVLERMLAGGAAPGTRGLAMAFGPGLTAEAMRFSAA